MSLKHQLFKLIICRGFEFLCFLGFIQHIYGVFFSYMSYRTHSDISLGMSDILPMPTFGFCTRFNEVLDRKNYKENGLFPHPPKAYQDGLNEQASLTVRQIFEVTPNPNKSIERCRLHIPNSFRMERYEGEECQKRIRVKQFLMQQYICYAFTPTVTPNYSLIWVTHSLQFSMLLYGIVLKSDFNRASILIPIVYETDDGYSEYPSESRSFVKKGFRFKSWNVHDESTLISNYFRLYYVRFQVELLPPPYDTHCSSYNPRHMCIRNCLTKKISVLNKLPFTEIFSEPLDIKPVSQKDLYNQTVETLIGKVHALCSKKCIHRPCALTYTSTSFEASLNRPLGLALKFEIFVPKSPTTKIISKPLSTFVEFAVYVCSCIGIWFGVSVHSLNPFNFKCLVVLKKTFSMFIPLWNNIKEFHTKNRRRVVK